MIRILECTPYRGNTRIPLRIENVEKHVDILYKESMPKCRNEPRRNVIRVGRSTATSLRQSQSEKK